MENKSKVNNISNFLSLQTGKAYLPSRRRLSTWLSTSRRDFCDSIKSRLKQTKQTEKRKSLAISIEPAWKLADKFGNKRESFLVLNGEANNSQFLMMEDHQFISERLPGLIAAE